MVLRHQERKAFSENHELAGDRRSLGVFTYSDPQTVCLGDGCKANKMNSLRKIWRLSAKHLMQKIGITILNYRDNTLRRDATLVDLLMHVREDGMAHQSFEELLNISRLCGATRQLKGAIAEFGVYKGGSAKILVSARGSREVHLFDSFDGMHRTSEFDLHRKGDFSDTSLERVKEYLRLYDRIFFHNGWFPQTTKGLEKNRFSFVHFDVDLYQSTMDALAFFYPRLVKGGIILSHDYNSISCPGVSKAFRQFMTDKPESVLELGGTTQCMIVRQ